MTPDWRVVRYPPSPSSLLFLVEHAAAGTERLLMGGFRAELRADGVTFADEATADMLWKSCRSDGGFLHFAEGGGVFWSNTFLGPLEPVGLARFDLHWRVVQCGPVVVALSHDSRPNLVISRGGIRPLGRSDIALVHFSTAEHGRAIAPPDHLLETRDGGRTLVHVAARPSPELDDPPLWLGDRLDIPPRDQGTGVHYVAEADRVRAAWVRHAVTSDAGRIAGGLRLADGTWVRSLSDPPRTFVAFRAASGRVTGYTAESASMATTTRTGATPLLPWGNALLARSDSGMYALRADGPERLPSPPRPALTVAADPKGRWIAALSAPWDDKGARGPGALMTFDGQRWRDHVGLHVTPLAVGSGRILVQGEQGQTALLPLLDPEHGAVDLTAEKLEEHSVSLLDRFVVHVERGRPVDDPGALRSLAWRDLGSGAVRSSTPVGLYRIRFADEAHGIGIHDNGGLSVTIDAGRTFTQVPLYGGTIDPRQEIRCWSRGCSFAETVAFTDEPLGSERPPTPSPTSELIEPPAGPYPGDDSYPKVLVAPSSGNTLAPSYRCHATPPVPREDRLANLLFANVLTSPDTPAPAVAGFVERKDGAFVFRGHDVNGDFRVQPSLTGSGRELLLGARDLLSAKQSSAQRLWAQQSSAQLELLLETAVTPVLVTRSFAIVIREEGQSGARLCVVHVNGHGECLVAASHLRAEAWPLPTGGAAVNVGAPGRQEILVLDVNGAPQARRWFAGVAGRLAFGPDGVMLFFPDGERGRTFSLTPGSLGMDVAWNTADEFGDCTRPASPGSTVVALDAPEIEIAGSALSFGRAGTWAGSTTGLGLLEFGPHGGCWRGALLARPFPITLRAVGGAMRGTFVGPNRSHQLVCRRAP